MNNKELYKEMCDNNNTIPIYSQYWWLDAICGVENWDVLLSNKGGKIDASMPIYFADKNKKYVQQPLFTQTNGIWINYPNNQKITSKLSFEKKVTTDIIEQLENLKLNNYSQHFHYNFKNWLPFYWKGFNQTTRYTYVIEDTSNFEEVYKNIDSSTKNIIRKAEKSVKIKRNIDINKFYEINKMTFDRKGMKIPYSFELLKSLDKACLNRECREILYAIDENENIHAAIYLVWDNMSIYYILGGINPEFKKTNATSLLLLEGLKLANEKKLKFDFEGSMDFDIEKFFSSFGGIQKPFFTISKRYSFELKSTVYSIVNNWNNLKRILKGNK